MTSYDMDTPTADAVALITELAVAPVHRVGLSMGGFVELRLAARHCELLRSSTVLNSSAAAQDRPGALKYRGLALDYLRIGPNPLRGPTAGLVFGKTFLADPDGRPVAEEFIERLGSCERVSMAKAVRGDGTRSNPKSSRSPSQR